MSKDAALFQSLASCGAALITFIGVCHELVGDTLFPWGPPFLGGPVGWHGVGLLAIASGLLMLGGTLHLIRFPVVPFSLLVAAIGAAFVVIAAVLHHQFHMFALAALVSGILTAYFHAKAVHAVTPAEDGDRRRHDEHHPRDR